MQLPSHLRRSRHGIFYYRIVFPRVIAEKIGQSEAQRSLNTRCPTEARAIGYQLSAMMSVILRRLKRIMAFDPNSINPDDIRKLTIERITIDPQGNKTFEGIKTSDDPKIAAQELNFITEKGTPCIAIRHTPRIKTKTIAHKDSQGSIKRTKNAGARRQIPLHPILLELGLRDYLDDLREIGATRFLPNLPMDSREKRDRYLSRDVNDYLKQIGVHEPRTKVLHSFRDTVSDELADVEMDPVLADQMTGHAPQGIKARRYRSKASPQKLADKGVNSLNFPCISVEKLRYKKSWWNE